MPAPAIAAIVARLLSGPVSAAALRAGAARAGGSGMAAAALGSNPNLYKMAFTPQGMANAATIVAQHRSTQPRGEDQPSLGGMALSTLARSAISLTGIFGATGKAAHAFANVMLNSQATLAKYSGQIAGALGGLEVRRMRIAAGSARRTAGSTAYLAKSTGQFEENFAPIKDFMTNVKNVALGTILGGINAAIEGMKQIFETDAQTKKRHEKERAEKAAQSTINRDFINGIAAGKFSGRKNPGPRNPEPIRRGW